MTKIQLVKYPELRERGIPFSRQHILNLEAAGMFPKRRFIGSRTSGWRVEDINAYVARVMGD